MSTPATSAATAGTPKHPFGSRLPGLDGLRALAAVSIMLLHATGSVGWPAWGPLTVLVTGCGHVAVPLFFVLSGFLITHLLLDEEERHGRVSLKNFYARRALRILPASLFYLAVLVVLTPLLKLSIEWIEIIAAATWWRNFLYHGWAAWSVHDVPGIHYTAHYWSLSVEEHFYFIWPLVVVLLPRRWRLPLLGSLLFVIPQWRAWGIKVYGIGGLNYWRTDYMLDHLLGGALLAVLFHWAQAQNNLSRLALKPLAGLLIAVALITFTRAFDVLVEHHVTNKILMLQASVLMLGLVLLVAVSVQIKDGWLHSVLNNPAMLWLGKISFSLYLWQELFSGVEFRAWPEHVPWNLLLSFLLSLLLSLLAATASCYLIERPFLNLRGRFHSGPRPVT